MHNSFTYRRLSVLAAAIAVLPAGAVMAQVSGTIQYSDYALNPQAARRVTVEVYAADGTTLLDTVRTNDTGAFTSLAVSLTGFVVRARPVNDGATVADDAAPTFANSYSAAVGSIGAGGGILPTVTYNTQSGSNAERAFAVADALQTSWLHAEIVRGAGNTANLATEYGSYAGGSVQSGSKISIAQPDRFNGDTIGHEFAHYIDTLDNLDNYAGVPHTFGQNLIPPGATPAQKLEAVRTAWGEGLASYIGVSSQIVAPHPNSPTLGNTAYEAYFDPSVNGDIFGADLENPTLMVGTTPPIASRGEGEELSTARVLWDLADNTNETHDRVTLGHVATYQMLVGKNYFDLGSLWNGLTATATDAQRVDYGGIFQLNGASPDPSSTSIIGTTLTPEDAPPTFSWMRGNDDGNDLFGLIAWDITFGTRLLDITGLMDATTFTLSASQWDTLNDYNGLVNFAITGSDTSAFATPAYFSDAYSFNIVPEPGTLGLLAIGGIALLRRRCRTGSMN